LATAAERLGIAGSGAIACGLAAAAAAAAGDADAPTLLSARSPESAERARARVATLCGRFEPPVPVERVLIASSYEPLANATFIVEAIAEHMETKAALLASLAELSGERAILASTTSSLSIEQLAGASGVPERFVGLHVFNPVTRMELVELVYPARAGEEVRERTRALCAWLGKTAIEVPDLPGFVVNNLLFPFLFGAVDLLAKTGINAEDLDACLCLGAGHAMGPLAVLDMVGLDVSIAIGEAIGVTVPPLLYEMVGDGKLGRKSGEGFHRH
jgi:3-hydroxybutyryl-CoA dehydrogenase